eukprot:TRINITY_DN240_c0_g1_i1.p1 TRINITY_DN240_c0_g1~~TRINITY_DN240_c0_g1_i1.p1  ORF type:complete len:255 (+),score=49.29 TRINITY_DN240_c0_g1_i1:45-809(+)
MALCSLPKEVATLWLGFLFAEDLCRCRSVCSMWMFAIAENAVLATRADIRRVIAVFNEMPPLGVELATKTLRMIPDTPEALAVWLKHPALLTQQVGKYLGEKDNKPVLRAVLQTCNFESHHLDDALRIWLTRYQPAMTSSGMRRILKAFAARFCECNPHYFCQNNEEAAEIAYLLCFAMLMLNTDAHNSTVQTKMTKQQFVAYIASSLHLKVNINYLEGLYDRITTHEIKPENNRKPLTSGWIMSTVRWMTHMI